jgi:hypothetical protein
MDHAVLLFGAKNDIRVRTREILLDETPGFMEDWAKAMSHRNDTLAGANTNVEAVNSALNADNTKLDSKVQELSARAPLYRLPYIPSGSTNDGDPPQKWYICPNCDTVFIRSIWRYKEYTHPCYNGGWSGKLGKSSVSMEGIEWKKHRFGA